MTNNKADTIENYIRNLLAQKDDNQIELKRTALADAISCAPSQISYVLSTRFTAIESTCAWRIIGRRWNSVDAPLPFSF